MKKKIIVQSVACVIASSSAVKAFADDQVMLVTANRVSQDISDVLADVEVIERAEIERLQPQSFVDLLVNIAGVDFVQSGGHGQLSSIFMRGTNSNHVLILIDGLRVGSATVGSKSVSDISIAQIERVEIVKGPRAALWGSDAVGGVIQIFTRSFQPGEHKITATVGSNNTKEIDASVGFGSEKLANTLTYSHKKSDGFDVRIDGDDDDDGYQSDSLALRGNYRLSGSDVIDWVAQSDQGDTEFDAFGVTEYKNHHWNIRYSGDHQGWQQQLALGNSRDKSDTNLADYEYGYETRRDQLSYLARKNLSETFSLAGGLEWLKDDVRKQLSNNAETERVTKSAHLSGNYSGQTLLVDAAIRFDDVENIASQSSLNLGVGYRLTPANQLSVNYAEGFKAPTFSDLYSPWGGNPELEYETSENWEFLYKGFYSFGSLAASRYHSNVDNLIDWSPDLQGNFTPQNIGLADIDGLDISFDIRHDKVSHKLTASYIKSRDGVTGLQLLRRAKQHFGYEFSYSGEQLDWFAQLQRVGKRPDNDAQTFMRVNLESYTKVNLGLSYSLNQKWQFKLKVNDLFNDAPTLVSGYRPVEREFLLSISYQNLH